MKTINVLSLAIALLLFSGNSPAQTATVPVDSIPAAFRASLNKLFDGYMKIEEALMQGKTADAGNASDALNKFTATINANGLTTQQSKIFNRQWNKILHNTEHIRDNAGNYDHQCEHFDYLTDEMYKLLKSFRFNTDTIYYNYTAEGNEGNSAHWLTTSSSMKTPYFKGAVKNIGDKQAEVIQPHE